MDLQACTAALSAKVGESSGLYATLKSDCGPDGVAYIDGRSVPNSVDNVNRDADCTIDITLENLAALVSGELEPATGFMTGRFRVAGDMSVARPRRDPRVPPDLQDEGLARDAPRGVGVDRLSDRASWRPDRGAHGGSFREHFGLTRSCDRVII